MILLYSETLYKLYLNTGLIIIFFYGFLFLFSILNFKKLNKQYRNLFIFFLISFLFEFLALWLKTANNGNSKYLDHIYLFLGITLVTFFYFNLQLPKSIKNGILIVFPTLLFSLIFLAFYNKGYLSAPVILPYKNMAFSVLCIFVHTKLIKSSKIKVLKNEPLFWFNLGFLLINLFYFLLIPLFNYAIDISDNLAFGIGIVKNLTDPFAIVLWCIGIFKLNKYGSTLVSLQ